MWPLWDAKEEDGAWHWDLLWGLVGRSGRGGERRWRYLWFFGGDRLDANEPGKPGRTSSND